MSATKSNPQEKATPPEKSFFESLQDFLASIKFAIILLACIALAQFSEQ